MNQTSEHEMPRLGDIVARLREAAGNLAVHDARVEAAIARIAANTSLSVANPRPDPFDSVERIAQALHTDVKTVEQLVEARGLEFVAHHAARLLRSRNVYNPVGALIGLCRTSDKPLRLWDRSKGAVNGM